LAAHGFHAFVVERGGAEASDAERVVAQIDAGRQDALAEAVEAGVVVVQSTRVGSGRVVRGERMTRQGLLDADNLTPQKARILLALTLTVAPTRFDVERIFLEY
jgi:L-asparaginase